VKNTVDSRIDYLKTELEKVDRKLESLESKAEEHRKVLMELQNKT